MKRISSKVGALTENRHCIKVSLLLCAALALGACTGTQVKDGASWAAGQALTIGLDAALGEPKYSTHDVYEPDEPVARDFVWEQWQETKRDAELAEYEQRKRRAESRAFQAEFDDFMQRLEEAEGMSANPPLSVLVSQ